MVNRTLLYVIGVSLGRLGGAQLVAREVAVQAGRAGWKIVFCFLDDPTPSTREVFSLPHVTLAPIRNQASPGLRDMVRFASLVYEHRPSVVVYSFHSIVRPYPFIARALCGSRVFYSDHSSRTGNGPSRWHRLARRLVVCQLDGIIGVSEYVKRRDAKEVRSVPVHAIYNGVDLDAAANAPQQARAFRDRYGIASERRVVIQVSWIIAQKGIDTFLQAAGIVLRERNDVEFVIVGEGERKAEYQRLAAQLGIAGHVTWTGSIYQPTAEGVFAAADVCCQLSRWQEAFGLTIAESMSFSCPVIGTRVGAIPELVEDGRTGFVVAPDNASDAAQRILTLLGDEGLRLRMGRAARMSAEQRFDVRKTVAARLELMGVT
jgi:glycosyltransferase involved in cell wall biosynthesis